MEKMQINNQIISMRKFVKQAKVHVINKLVKEVKHLKNKHGNEVQVAKYRRKAERLLLEINLIKKFDVDDVSKTALSNKDSEHISNEPDALEDRAMARLINFVPIQKQVRKFNSEFPFLVKIMPDVIQQWDVKKQHISKGAKELKAGEIKYKKKERLKNKLLHTDNGMCQKSVVNKTVIHDDKENASIGDTFSVASQVKNRRKKAGKTNDMQSGKDQLPELEKTSLNEAPDGDFYAGGSNLLHEEGRKSDVEDSISVKKQGRKDRHISTNVANSVCSGNMFNRSKFRKLPHVGKSVKNSSADVKKQDFSSNWKGVGTSKEFSSLKSRKKLHRDFSKPKFDVSLSQKNLMPSDQKNKFSRRGDKKTPVPIHPSWEAKRRMNIEAKNILPFQGKKIKFCE